MKNKTKFVLDHNAEHTMDALQLRNNDSYFYNIIPKFRSVSLVVVLPNFLVRKYFLNKYLKALANTIEDGIKQQKESLELVSQVPKESIPNILKRINSSLIKMNELNLLLYTVDYFESPIIKEKFNKMIELENEIVENLEFMLDDELMASIKKSLNEIETGGNNIISWEDYKTENSL